MKKKTHKKRDYYRQLSDILSSYERYQYDPIPLSWVSDRISWCWKFRKITEEQMAELCERITRIFNEGIIEYR